jgi:hypothetical protein
VKHEIYGGDGGGGNEQHVQVLSLGIQNDRVFGGTDTLPYNAIVKVLEWLPSVNGDDTLVFAEGDRLACKRFFDEVQTFGKLLIVWVNTPDDVASQRRSDRAEQEKKKLQNASWIAGRVTKAKNLVDAYEHVAINGTLPTEEQLKLLNEAILRVSCVKS